jgi:hypothetical protein
MAKTTNREYFEQIATIVPDNEELTAFVQKQMAALDAKSSKANAKAKALTAERTEVLFEAFKAIGGKATVREVLEKADLDTEVYTKERVSQLFRKLVEDGKVTAEKDKRVTVYTLV